MKIWWQHKKYCNTIHKILNPIIPNLKKQDIDHRVSNNPNYTKIKSKLSDTMKNETESKSTNKKELDKVTDG